MFEQPCGCIVEYEGDQYRPDYSVNWCEVHAAAAETARQRDALLVAAELAIKCMAMEGDHKDHDAPCWLDQMGKALKQAQATDAASRECDRCGFVAGDVIPPGFQGDKSGLCPGCNDHVEEVAQATDAAATEVPEVVTNKSPERIACVLKSESYKVGDPPPSGYIARQEWAAVQTNGGLRQSLGPDNKWYFPQEMPDAAATEVPG